MTQDELAALDRAELLPCSFCGGEAVLAGTSTPGVNTVRCKACGCAAGFGTDAEAIAAWNRRATAAEAREAKLRAALERLRDCDWVITLPDRMDAVRDIARAALETDNG